MDRFRRSVCVTPATDAAARKSLFSSGSGGVTRKADAPALTNNAHRHKFFPTVSPLEAMQNEAEAPRAEAVEEGTGRLRRSHRVAAEENGQDATDDEIAKLGAELERVRFLLRRVEAENEFLRDHLAKEEDASDRGVAHERSSGSDDSTCNDEECREGSNARIAAERAPAADFVPAIELLASLLRLSRQPSGSEQKDSALDAVERAMGGMADHLMVEGGGMDLRGGTLAKPLAASSAREQCGSMARSVGTVLEHICIRESLAERIHHVVNTASDDGNFGESMVSIAAFSGGGKVNEKKLDEDVVQMDINTVVRVCDILISERDMFLAEALNLVESARREVAAEQELASIRANQNECSK